MSEIREKKVKETLYVYYSRPEIQKAIFDFSNHRETVPSYMMENYGKRPDSLQYPQDVFNLVKRGATSFHCSEEIWQDPLRLSTGMTEKQISDLRQGWDLLIDIDCKWIDYSKKAAEAVISVLKENGVKNIGLKFSGNKGFHIIVPWKSFPKEIAGEETRKLFPELPRKIINFIRFESGKMLGRSLSEKEIERLRGTKIKRGIKCNSCNEISEEYKQLHYLCLTKNCSRGVKESNEGGETKKILSERVGDEIKKIHKCTECGKQLELNKMIDFYECRKCNINSLNEPNNFSRHEEEDIFEILGLDLILVSPRHLFRSPYSLHEKTALSSIVIPLEKLKDFDIKDANPMKAEVLNFLPEANEGEATELVTKSLDFNRLDKKEEKTKTRGDFAPIKLDKLSDSFLPPSVQQILLGLSDGRKRALFILLNLFRSLGIEKEEIEKRISDWNQKNKPPLKEGYVKSQLIWSWRNKIVPPPNFDKDYYRAVGVIPSEEEMRLKNPVNYVLKKSQQSTGKKTKTKDNFKNSD